MLLLGLLHPGLMGLVGCAQRGGVLILEVFRLLLLALAHLVHPLLVGLGQALLQRIQLLRLGCHELVDFLRVGLAHPLRHVDAFVPDLLDLLREVTAHSLDLGLELGHAGPQCCGLLCMGVLLALQLLLLPLTLAIELLAMPRFFQSDLSLQRRDLLAVPLRRGAQIALQALPRHVELLSALPQHPLEVALLLLRSPLLVRELVLQGPLPLHAILEFLLGLLQVAPKLHQLRFQLLHLRGFLAQLRQRIGLLGRHGVLQLLAALVMLGADAPLLRLEVRPQRREFLGVLRPELLERRGVSCALAVQGFAARLPGLVDPPLQFGGLLLHLLPQRLDLCGLSGHGRPLHLELRSQLRGRLLLGGELLLERRGAALQPLDLRLQGDTLLLARGECAAQLLLLGFPVGDLRLEGADAALQLGDGLLQLPPQRLGRGLALADVACRFLLQLLVRLPQGCQVRLELRALRRPLREVSLQAAPGLLRGAERRCRGGELLGLGAKRLRRSICGFLGGPLRRVELGLDPLQFRGHLLPLVLGAAQCVVAGGQAVLQAPVGLLQLGLQLRDALAAVLQALLGLH
mmetsp:Transcript_39990/g.114982  ORF Transcript_39990/g.114982 Transcript_39990/m.114982 type:complete len:574 (+) Transcript_39990:877-2598(+)